MNPTVYIETTIPSYLVARPSRDMLVAASQQATHAWWNESRSAFELRTSDVVLEECGDGDPRLAKARLGLLDGIPVLRVTAAITALARALRVDLAFPDRVADDANHLCIAAVHRIDYLLTWNCTHLANAQIVRRLGPWMQSRGLVAPTICTPSMLTRKGEAP